MEWNGEALRTDGGHATEWAGDSLGSQMEHLDDVDPETAGEHRARMLSPGDVLASRFEVIEQLGFGGMGAVYRVSDRRLGKDRALKVMLPSLLEREKARGRFLEEIRITQELSHPGIVRVHDLGHDDDRNLEFFTMEYVPGKTLHRILAENGGQLPVRRAVTVVTQICEALRYAHQHTLHRDLKPQNVMIQPDGTVKLLDFGLAKIMSPGRMTKSSMALGTAYYQSPEQSVHLQELDERADIYSVGVILYQLLTGQIPVGMIQPPSKLRPGTPSYLDNVVSRCLQPKKEDRYSTVEELLAGLRAGSAPTAQCAPRPNTRPRRHWKRRVKWAAIVSAVLGGFIMISSVAGVYMFTEYLYGEANDEYNRALRAGADEFVPALFQDAEGSLEWGETAQRDLRYLAAMTAYADAAREFKNAANTAREFKQMHENGPGDTGTVTPDAAEGQGVEAPASAAPAATHTTADPEAKGREIIDRYINAIGGRRAFANVRSLEVTRVGTKEAPGLLTPTQVHSVVVWASGKFFEKSVFVPGFAAPFVAVSRVSNGEVWDFASNDGTLHRMRGPHADERLVAADSYETLLIHDKLFEQVRFAGQADVDGVLCNVVTARGRYSGTEWTLYFSVSSGLQRMERQAPLNGPTTTVRYDDYRDIGGVKVAHAVAWMYGGETITLRATNVVVNQDVPTELFESEFTALATTTVAQLSRAQTPLIDSALWELGFDPMALDW